jgi:hypothetical protein
MTDEAIIQKRESVTSEELKEAGVDLDRDFPGCKTSDFKKYPVLSDGGWFIVIKNQKTLASVSRKRWRLLGPIPLLSDNLELD